MADVQGGQGWEGVRPGEQSANAGRHGRPRVRGCVLAAASHGWEVGKGADVEEAPPSLPSPSSTHT